MQLPLISFFSIPSYFQESNKKICKFYLYIFIKVFFSKSQLSIYSGKVEKALCQLNDLLMSLQNKISPKKLKKLS